VTGYYAVCYQPLGGGAITPIHAIAPQNLNTAGNSFTDETITGIVGELATGAYYVGPCTAGDTANLLFGLGEFTTTYMTSSEGTYSFASTGAGSSQHSPSVKSGLPSNSNKGKTVAP
jgi:hypothetical protein